MNINGKSSNGIVVGPEYSRMIAEILLQQIDKEVYMLLLGITRGQVLESWDKSSVKRV